MKVCEQKFLVIQYMDLSLPSIYRAPFSTCRDLLRRTDSDATSRFDGVHKAQTKSENALYTLQYNTKRGLCIATCLNNAVELCHHLEIIVTCRVLTEDQPFKDKARTALFKGPVRTAL